MNKENQVENISRLEFLKKMGLSGASLMAVYCGVTMSSCKNEDNATPAPTGKTATYDITTLKSGTIPLNAVGGYYVDATNSIVIANTSDNKYVAVTLICTHAQNKNIIYSTNKFMCTVHSATFNNSGKATSSVTSTDLRTYPVMQAGNILTVTL